MGSLFESIDKNIFLFLNGNHNPVLDYLMFGIRNLLLWIPLCFILLFIIASYFKHKHRTYILLNTSLIVIFILVQVIVCNNILPSLLEDVVIRERPCFNSEITRFINFDNFHYIKKVDFFSAKICAVLSLSIFVIYSFSEFKWVKFILLFWAILMCYDRIYIGAHYPANILVNVLVGTLVGMLVYRIYYYVKNSILVI